MKPVRIFRHIACEPPGYLGDFLRARGVPFEVVCIDEGQTVPADLDGVSGLVFMGGAGSVHDSHSWIAEEIALIRRAVAEAVPVLGVCLGGQLMSVALGGEVTRAPAMEIGWHEVRQVPGAGARDWLGGAPERFTAYHWHAWTFSVPEGAERLLASDCTDNQAFALGPHLALQFHLEMTAPMVNGWVRRYGGDLEDAHPCIESAALMTRGLAQRLAALHRVSDAIYGRWLDGVVDARAPRSRRA